MKKLFFPAALAVMLWAGLAPGRVFAQRDCGTTAYAEMMLAQYPEIVERQQRAAANAAGAADRSLANSIVTIPVVVHIVFNGAAQNLPDERVYSQIAVLNEDFRLLNTDAANTPGAFAPAVADVQIQFCLASVDPGGNPTSGITRTATAHGPFENNAADEIKATAAGGVDAWPAADYLNIWVCNLAGGLLGYSSFPGWPAARDGIVIDFAFFGYEGGASAPFDLGRTGTHEAGHYFGLAHIWGDALCGDDGIGDTPTAEDANGGCPAFPLVSSCGNAPNGEMFMNYMDYTDDACMFMFTNGQKTAMLNHFLPFGLRQSLTVSGGCSGACPRALYFTDDFSGLAANFVADEFVVGWNEIAGGSDVTYRANEYVQLRPGFHAQSGNNFRAYINGCTGPPAAPPETSTRETDKSALPGVRCTPNPFGGTLAINFDLPEKANVSVVLFDALGRPALAEYQSVELEAGAQTLSLDTAPLPPGVYYLEYRGGKSRQVFKLVKTDE